LFSVFSVFGCQLGEIKLCDMGIERLSHVCQLWSDLKTGFDYCCGQKLLSIIKSTTTSKPALCSTNLQLTYNRSYITLLLQLLLYYMLLNDTCLTAEAQGEKTLPASNQSINKNKP